MAAILTIEDSVETQLILKKSLEQNYQVHTCYDLASARVLIGSHQIDLIVLDLVLPDGFGMDFLKELCSNQSTPSIPIIILSSLDNLESRVSGLSLGADDYMTKPFEASELLARVESVLRRGPTRQTESILSLADVSINLSQQLAIAHVDSKQIDLSLTPLEFKILVCLWKENGLKISREDLQKKVWGKTYISKRNVDTHICKLRKKLEQTRLDIQNKRGAGYYLSVEAAGNTPTTVDDALPAFGKSSQH